MKVVFIGRDDETANLAQMSVRIRWPDAASLVAATAQEGIEATNEFSPDVVLLNPPFTDTSLPEAIPFSMVELMARIWALLRRIGDNVEVDQEKPVLSGSLFIDPATFELFQDNQLVPVTSTELKLLHMLMKNHGSVVTHEVVGRTIWGEQVDSAQLVNTYIKRLRRKIGDNAGDPIWIASVHGVGYIGPTRANGERMPTGKELC